MEDAVRGLQSEKVDVFTYPQKPFLEKKVMPRLSLLLLLEVLTLAQAVPPGKPAPPALPNSTAQSAVIRGTVVNHTDGSPISGVKISVSVPGYGAIVGSDTSDITGHYAIHVPPEKYSAYATKDGFVGQFVGHGLKLQGTVQALDGRLPEQLIAYILYRDPVDDARHAFVRTAPVSSADGTFQFMNVQPGIYDIGFNIRGISSIAERQFFVRTISFNGRDVIDTGITVPERYAPVEISATLAFQPGRMLGKTLDSKDRPIPGARLALMSADRNKRRSSPYWKEMTSDRDGSFRFPDVIPGDYLLIVWPPSASWEDTSGLDPEAFAILEQHATSVHVDRAQVVEKNVQLTAEVRNLLERLLR